MIKYDNNILIGKYEDNLLWYNKENQEIIKTSVNKFNHGEIVKTTKNHFSQKDFTKVLEPNYTVNRGWVYGEEYINRNCFTGGSGYWNEENYYEKLDKGEDILFAKKLQLQNNISQKEYEVKNLKEELSKIEYSLELINPNYKNIK